MKRLLLSTVALAACSLAFAKLPPLDEAAKAKAAETTAKNAWQAKVDAYQLCKAQDRVAAHYGKTIGKAGAQAAANGKAVPVKDTKAVAASPAAAAAAAASTPTAASAPLPAASGTPVAAAPPPPCTDPGPFAYAPPEQKPLESSGAHSPAATAASPPSVKQPQAEMSPPRK